MIELADVPSCNVCVRVHPPKDIIMMLVQQSVYIVNAPQEGACYLVGDVSPTKKLGISLFWSFGCYNTVDATFMSESIKPQEVD